MCIALTLKLNLEFSADLILKLDYSIIQMRLNCVFHIRKQAINVRLPGCLR